jgi:hypothetical protein
MGTTNPPASIADNHPSILVIAAQGSAGGRIGKDDKSNG